MAYTFKDDGGTMTYYREYNKEVLEKNETLVGNWVEERALRDQIGTGRYAPALALTLTLALTPTLTLAPALTLTLTLILTLTLTLTDLTLIGTGRYALWPPTSSSSP